MQNRKLSMLLQKLEHNQANQQEDDQIVSINDELARNIRAVYGGGNGSCTNNDSCDNNGECKGNSTCNNNGTCNNSCGGGSVEIGG